MPTVAPRRPTTAAPASASATRLAPTRPVWADDFLANLARGSDPERAAVAAGTNRTAAYRLRKDDRYFRADWRAALKAAEGARKAEELADVVTRDRLIDEIDPARPLAPAVLERARGRDPRRFAEIVREIYDLAGPEPDAGAGRTRSEASEVGTWLDEWGRAKVAEGGKPDYVRRAIVRMTGLLSAAVPGALIDREGLTETQLTALADQFRDVLAERECRAEHVRNTHASILRVLREAGWRLSDWAVDRALGSLRKAGKAESTVGLYRMSIRAFVNWIQGGRGRPPLPADLSAEAITRGLAEARNRGWAATTCNSALSLLKEFCTWASHPDQGYLRTNPAAHVEYLDAGKDVRRRSGTFSQDNLARLLAWLEANPKAARGLTGMDRAAAYRAIACTGLPTSELHRLKAGDFHLVGAEPHVELGDGREVPILPPGEAGRFDAYLTGKTGEKIAFPPPADGRHLGELLARDVQAAKIKDPGGGALDITALRHTFCERGARLRVPIPIMRGWMGFAEEKTVERLYLRWLRPDVVKELRVVHHFDGAGQRSGGEAKSDGSAPRPPSIDLPKPTKPGGPRSGAGRKGARDAVKRLETLALWDAAAAAKTDKNVFCEEAGIDEGYLDRCIDWRRTRRNRERKKSRSKMPTNGRDK